MTMVLARVPGVVVRRIADETLLVPITGELAKMQRIFVLDEVGQCVWEHLDGRCDLAAVVRSVTDRFDVSTEQAEVDIGDFAAAILEAGLVVKVQKETDSESDGRELPADHR